MADEFTLPFGLGIAEIVSLIVVIVVCLFIGIYLKKRRRKPKTPTPIQQPIIPIQPTQQLPTPKSTIPIPELPTLTFRRPISPPSVPVVKEQLTKQEIGMIKKQLTDFKNNLQVIYGKELRDLERQYNVKMQEIERLLNKLDVINLEVR